VSCIELVSLAIPYLLVVKDEFAMTDFELADTISIYKLKFGPNSPYFGLQVEVSGMTIGEHNEMMRLAVASINGDNDADRATAGLQSNDHVRGCFFRRIRSWNLTKKGEPVPVSEVIMNELDSRLFTVLVRYWLDELTAIPEDLLGKSNSGDNLEELSMTMERI